MGCKWCIDWGEPKQAPNLAILLGPRVCIYMYVYIIIMRLTESVYNVLFLCITYARHVAKMASLLECRVCRLQNWKLLRTKSQTSGQIYCIVIPRETYYSSKVDGIGLPYTLVEI